MTTTSARRGRPFGADGVETRAKILHSAREIFAAVGFERATLKQIAEDAGITRNAVANYFVSKLELYEAALASVREAVADRLLGDARAVVGPVCEQIMAVFHSAVAYGQIDNTIVRFFVISTAEAITHPDLHGQALLPTDAVRDYLREVLDDAARTGAIDPEMDTEGIAQVCIDLLWGLAMDIGFYSDERRTQQTMAAVERVISATLVTTAGNVPGPT